MTNTEMITNSTSRETYGRNLFPKLFAVSSLRLPLNFLDLSNFNITDSIFVFSDGEKN